VTFQLRFARLLKPEKIRSRPSELILVLELQNFL
jgi:hypothetical protein